MRLLIYLHYLHLLIKSSNRTPGSRFYSDLLDTWADSVCIHQLVFKALGCSYNLRLLPINAHVTWWPRCSIVQVWASHGSQNQGKTLLQHSQRCHKGEFRQVSISARQRSLRCGQNHRGPFLRATLPMTAESWARAIADTEETKGLITPTPRLVSAIIVGLCHCMIAITTV